MWQFFAQGSYFFTNLVVDFKVMLHTKYQTSKLCGFRGEDFLRFSYISLCKSDKPQGGPFLPEGHYLNKLGRGPLGEATYQI